MRIVGWILSGLLGLCLLVLVAATGLLWGGLPDTSGEVRLDGPSAARARVGANGKDAAAAEAANPARAPRRPSRRSMSSERVGVRLLIEVTCAAFATIP